MYSMLRNIVMAYKKALGRIVSLTRRTIKLPVSLKCKLRYIKIYTKAGIFSGLYIKPQKKILFQTLFINSRSWDYLIVLDACRYDFFEKHIWKYMDGKLLRVWSPGGYTAKWFERTWYGTYRDVIYISSTPHINRRFNSYEKFLRIVDVWNIGWDEKLYTVPPWKMNKIVLQYLKFLKIRYKLGLYTSKPRIVIHYIQPHIPYIAGPINFNKIYDFYMKKKVIRLGRAILLHLMNVLNDIEKVNYVLRKAYEENLKLVLSYVSELIPSLSGKIAITSDHGELLGEYGLYFHPTDAPIPELRYVPLFIVK